MRATRSNLREHQVARLKKVTQVHAVNICVACAIGCAAPDPSLNNSTCCKSPTSQTDSTLNTFKLPLENNLASSHLCFKSTGCDMVASWPFLPCKMARISLLVPDSKPKAVCMDKVYLQGGEGSTAILSVDSPAGIHLL
jgi:hypothetical protein